MKRGAEVSPGDTVDTGSGRAQLRFTDGAMVSLQPQTQFRIDAYEFKAEAVGGEKGFFSLLKGAMRTITGAIGKSDRKAYRLDTAVATIGIRGTEYAVAYGNSITVTTNSGLVEVCNSAGCLLVEAGQSAYVPDANTLPAFTRRNALDPLGQPPGPPLPGFSSGDNPNNITPPVSPQAPPQLPPQAPPQGPYNY
ncbi:MAG: FecR family protein [Rhodocyclaceae bacterium]|nr:FecR family protein [Rhodocyclaceae bacterium]